MSIILFNQCLSAPHKIDKMKEDMQRLLAAAEEIKQIKSAAELGRYIGESDQAITNWKRRGIPGSKLLDVSAKIGVNPVWIKTGVGQKNFTVHQIEIPQFDTGGSMGGGLILKDQPGVIQSWKVSREWLNKNVKSHTGAQNLCIVTGFGDSMRPMFNPGDPLLVDRGVTSVDFDAVYFFRVGDEGFLKRLQKIPGEGLRVISTNKEYESWTIRQDMDFEVFGRVLKVWCSEDF